MTDIHCHVLPDVDDGPETIEESLEMCRMAASDGIKTIVATPHFNPGSYETPSVKVLGLIKELDERLKAEGIDIRILAGADVAVFPDLLHYLKKEEYLLINRSRYLLVEFPHLSVPQGWDAFLLSLLRSGITPIITHPERNAWFVKNPDALYPVVSQGVMTQVTAMSLTGEFGDEAREVSLFLIERGLAHVIATDAHSASYRTPILSEAAEIAADIAGPERANALVSTTPSAIVENRPVLLPPPIERAWKKKNLIQRLFA